MTEVLIGKERYVLITKEEYQTLQRKAALKARPERLFAIKNARAYSKKMIRKWETTSK